ncbi:Bug family tripartite tricarboxylate transporter substrate binding protein [Pseudorhodoferax sp.]|uniref:Bug family tripartite tricarboxylate transporter substrate binding protein n=1 Tax=Pseudorhodoferax sp. TaxID=1993553 RepID=UPI002DD698A3|nr:tripartite tricarboxylate transporter substrate binding protein [Pseudorhodoferax sp.]
MTLSRRSLMAAGIAALAAGSASAQGARPVRLVVPLAPGGGLDAIGRQLALSMAPALASTVIVENKPGASGTLAMEFTARASVEQPTMVLAMGSTVGIVPHFMRQLGYDSVRDFAPVAQVGLTPFVLVVAADHPARTLAQFVAHTRGKPKATSFGSYGNGTSSHIVGAAFNQAAGIDLLHVPYKGSALALNDLIGGQVTAVVADFGSAGQHLGPNGRVRALAVTGAKRSPGYPDVPTFGEQGYAALDNVVGWVGLFAPAATPRATVEQWAQAATAAVGGDAVKERLLQLGYVPTGTPTRAFAAIVQQERERWGEIIRSTGVTVE